MNLIDKIAFYLAYPFVRYALIVGVLIALCSSLLGVTLVLKRFSFIGDGLSHVAFGAMAIASVLKIANNTWFVLPATVVCAIIIKYLVISFSDEMTVFIYLRLNEIAFSPKNIKGTIYIMKLIGRLFKEFGSNLIRRTFACRFQDSCIDQI